MLAAAAAASSAHLHTLSPTKQAVLCSYVKNKKIRTGDHTLPLRNFLNEYSHSSQDMSVEGGVFLYFMLCLLKLMKSVNDPVTYDMYNACIQAFLFVEHDHVRYKNLLLTFVGKLDKLRLLVVTSEEDNMYIQCTEVMQILQKDFQMLHTGWNTTSPA